MRRAEILIEDVISSEALNIPNSTDNDHWMRRVSIMTLLSGIGAIACGHNITDLDDSLGHQITLSGIAVAVTGSLMWLVTHLILKGSRNA